MSVAYKLTLTLFCLAMALLSLAYRTGGVAPGDFVDTLPIPSLDTWQVRPSKTLISQAEIALQENNVQLADELTLQALGKNLTSGLAFSQLLSNKLKHEQPSADTDYLAGLSERLWPSYTGVHLKLANYWRQRGNLEKMLHSLNILMVRNPAFRKDIYPILFELLNYKDGLDALTPYIQANPSWWKGFFSFVAQQPDLPKLRLVYGLRGGATSSLTPEERTAYINALIKNKLWEEAYYAWLSSLNEKQLALSGFIYDGGFESNDKTTGFGWRFNQTPLAKIVLNSTNGMSGQKALHLTLLDQGRINFQNISQIIKLNPNPYSLSLRYRIDRLQTSEGLSWRVRCLNEKNTLLGESKPLANRSSWEQLSFNFEVPIENCPLQVVRLEATSPYANNHTFKGSLWFDEIQITRLQQTDND